MDLREDIEFLDSVVEPGEPIATTDDQISSGVSPLAVLLVVLVAGVALIVVGGGDDAPVAQGAEDSVVERNGDRGPEIDRGSEVESGPIPDLTLDELWPPTPADRDPSVVRIPGPAELPGAFVDLADATIVYVNTAGDPTVVSFATGDVFEVDVAAIRVHDRFAVEDGAVVSFQGSNPSLDEATENAIVFHTYREVDPPGVGSVQNGLGAGPELCLSGRSCSGPNEGVQRLTRGGLTVERLDAFTHWQIDEIFTTWTPVDRWLVADGDVRIPQPLGPIWVIAPGGGGAPSSVGLL